MLIEIGLLELVIRNLSSKTWAIEILTQAARREPDYFSAHLRLASLYGLADRIDVARAELAVALRINAKFKMVMAEAFYASSKIASAERFKLGLRKVGLPG